MAIHVITSEAMHSKTRTLLVGGAITVAVLLVAAAAITAGLIVTKLPSLQQADALLYEQIIDTDAGLIADAQAASHQVVVATIAPASPTSNWQAMVLPADDPWVQAVTALESSSTSLHQWVLLFVNNSVTRVTTKTPTQQDLNFNDTPPIIIDVPEPGEPAISQDSSFLITNQQAVDLLTAMQMRHRLYQASISSLASSLDQAQKQAALTDYTKAEQDLQTAISMAQFIYDSTKGTVKDDATRVALDAAIKAAQQVLDTSGGITAGDSKMAADVQAATDAITAAVASLKDPSDKVSASIDNPRITKATDPLPAACQSRGVGTNGCLDPAKLCVVQRDQLLNCKAIEPFNKLSAAFDAKFGHELYVDCGYRNYDSQVAMFQRYGSPRAAIPGNSNHGWGLAVDLPDWEYPSEYPPGQAAEIKYGTPQENWLIANGPKFGWYFDVAGEPWHMDYKG